MITLRRRILIILVLVLLLFVNPLVLGFLHRYVSLGVESFLILIIALVSITVLFDLRLKRFKLALVVVLSGFTVLYYYSKSSLVYYSEQVFFEKRENQLTSLAQYLIKNPERNASTKEKLDKTLRKLNINAVDYSNSYVAFKVANGATNFDGFLYSYSPKAPEHLLGVKIYKYRHIKDNWYAFTTR